MTNGSTSILPIFIQREQRAIMDILHINGEFKTIKDSQLNYRKKKQKK